MSKVKNFYYKQKKNKKLKNMSNNLTQDFLKKTLKNN